MIGSYVMVLLGCGFFCLVLWGVAASYRNDCRRAKNELRYYESLTAHIERELILVQKLKALVPPNFHPTSDWAFECFRYAAATVANYKFDRRVYSGKHILRRVRQCRFELQWLVTSMPLCDSLRNALDNPKLGDRFGDLKQLLVEGGEKPLDALCIVIELAKCQRQGWEFSITPRGELRSHDVSGQSGVFFPPALVEKISGRQIPAPVGLEA